MICYMKKTKVTLSLFLLSCLFLFSSCEKDTKELITEKGGINEIVNTLDFGKYSKEMVVQDVSGKNSAVIKIGSNDSIYFQQITPKSVVLIPVKYGQNTSEAVAEFCKQNNISTEFISEEENPEDTSGISVYSMILSKTLADDVENVILYNMTPSLSKAEWIYSTEYGYAPTSGLNAFKQQAIFTGHNVWHVGYYGLSYKQNSTSNISTIVSKYAQIRTNDIYKYTRNDCTVMYAYLKYKGQNPSVVVEFVY